MLFDNGSCKVPGIGDMIADALSFCPADGVGIF
jgi:hypothetical protein